MTGAYLELRSEYIVLVSLCWYCLGADARSHTVLRTIFDAVTPRE